MADYLLFSREIIGMLFIFLDVFQIGLAPARSLFVFFILDAFIETDATTGRAATETPCRVYRYSEIDSEIRRVCHASASHASSAWDF